MRSFRGWARRPESGFRLELHRISERKIDRGQLERSIPVEQGHLFDHWVVRAVASDFMVKMCDRRETISKRQGRLLHNTIIFPRIQERHCYIWAASDDRRILLPLALDVATKQECREIPNKAFSTITQYCNTV
jgi:hypothetical protein